MIVQSLGPNKHKQVRHSNHNSHHTVQFYVSDTSFVAPLCAYVRDSLESGGVCIVFATEVHLKAISKTLQDSGVDPLAARMQGRYVALDAQRTLDACMVEGLPDWGRFVHTFGPVLRTAADKGNGVYIYSEMIALLWKHGNKEAVMCLEEFWNRLQEEHSFSVHCAYPELHFVNDSHVQQKIRACHGRRAD